MSVIIFKVVTLVVVTTFAGDKPPKVETVGQFYGETSTDAMMACRTYGKTQIPISKLEYRLDKVFTRGFACLAQ